MVWNKSGYQGKFSSQQMHIMDKRQNVEKISSEESKKEKIKKVQQRIIELLQKEEGFLSQVEIAERLGEKDILVLEALNSIDKKKIAMSVTPLDESGNSTRWGIN
ncbi:hypothetical protein P4H66_17920 [Paenibacillus dokdonensis]|uniref:Uncharacterized protein n=1 Tax=Paenibacillus dokdonensis TaxID=2567944 RepID=A0ABU6GQN8_9BACL|nr:hypothetical protein [Paenibacillus dokdonensis]MEC0241694.1 hypothetical protein [Paenibacillus dokdonensis]